MTAEVHAIPVKSLFDIPARLRDLADSIEAGERGEIEAALVLLDDGKQTHAIGLGATDATRGMAMLGFAAQRIGR